MIVYKHARCTAGFRKHALTFPHLHIPNPQRQNSTAQQNADCNHRGPFHFCLHKAVPFLPSPSAAPAGCMFCINTVLISPFYACSACVFRALPSSDFHWIPPLSPPLHSPACRNSSRMLSSSRCIRRFSSLAAALTHKATAAQVTVIAYKIVHSVRSGISNQNGKKLVNLPITSASATPHNVCAHNPLHTGFGFFDPYPILLYF